MLTANFAKKVKMDSCIAIIVSNNAVSGDSNHIVVNQQASDFDDAVIMQPAAYKKIFFSLILSLDCIMRKLINF